MINELATRKCTLSLIVPCFNESRILKNYINEVRKIADDYLSLEVIIVDVASTDRSFSIAEELANTHSNIAILKHVKNQGKGAAIRTGVQKASGDFVAI